MAHKFQMLVFLKRLVPQEWLDFFRPYYHGLWARFAAAYFGFPSRQLIVAGITGTAGKSTTAAMLAKILNAAGRKCGYITTVSFFNSKTEQVNKHGLSMPDGWRLQKQLRQMLDAGCTHAVVECTSEGLRQNRHLGTEFAVAIFTNLSKAHLEAHRGFENYKAAKARLFSALAKARRLALPRTIVVNGDDPHAEYFLGLAAGRKLAVGQHGLKMAGAEHFLLAQADSQNQTFTLAGVKFKVKLLGAFNILNAALAAVAAFGMGVPFPASAQALSDFSKIRGRMELVPNELGLVIIVDYGCEPATIEAALKASRALAGKKLIHVFGATGGHRDRQKRFIFGKLSAEYADEIIVTNDDVYESDPREIAVNILAGIKASVTQTAHQVILDRRLAITQALKTAQSGDTVLITGKGSEQFLVLPGGRRIPWDDVEAVKTALRSPSP